MDGSWESQLVGRTVAAIEQWEGGVCVVALAGGYAVQIESLWRLVSAGTLSLSSKDDGQRFGRSEPIRAVQELSMKLLGRPLTAIYVTPGIADLTLEFGEHSLQAIADSSGYEAWQVNGPGGTVVVGRGGGNVTVRD